MPLIGNNFNHYLYEVSFFYYYAFHDNNCLMNFVIFRNPSDNFEVKFCLILLIIPFTLGKYGDLMPCWFFY